MKRNSIRWRFNLSFTGILLIEAAMLIVTAWTANCVSDEWRSYQDTVVRRQTLLMTIRSDFGYGGMVHGFKNYVLRREPAYADRAAASMLAIVDAVAAYRMLANINVAEREALQGIVNVLDQYGSGLATARSMVAAGKDSMTIDVAVKVDDRPAIEAFTTIDREFVHHTRTAQGQLTRMATRLGIVLGVSFLALLAINLSGFLLVRRILGSLNKAVDATTRIAAGDLLGPVETDDLEETGQVLVAMKKMQDSLLERGEQERQQAARLRVLATAIEQSPESIVLTGLDASIEYANAAFLEISGYTRAEIAGRNPRILQSGKTPQETYRALWTSLKNGEVWQGILFNKKKNGEEYVESATIAPVRNENGCVTHYLAVKQDISEKLRAEAEIFRLTHFDVLTGLPNRILMLDRLGQLISSSLRADRQGVLLLLDIDAFKIINEGRGMEAGDDLLRALGFRLSELLRAGDTLARLSADEFAVLLSDLSDSQDAAMRHAMSVVEKIQRALEQPFPIGEDAVTVHASVGISLFPTGTADKPADVMRRADTALHRAKRAGGNRAAYYDLDMGEAMFRRYRVEQELRKAISARELRIYLQPQVLTSGEWVGGEALVRWQHPVLGLLSPAAFVPLAEESDLIVDLGDWVLKEVCGMLAELQSHNRPLRLSVNISPRHFAKPGFADSLKKILDNSGADPHHLVIEITEGIMIDGVGDTINKMSELASLGLHFSLDDFGTGYSSLSYLKQLPIRELKIDKAFILDAPRDPKDAAMVKAILAVAEQMDLRVVAEGVEDVEHARFLADYSHVVHQGYHHERPGPALEILDRWRGMS